MAWRKESGSSKGRGFGNVDGVPSLLNRLKAWIVKPIADGGPGWYIIDDNSAAGINPYIVCANKPGQPTNSSRTKIVHFYLSSTANIVVADFWMHWNITTHVGTRRVASFTLTTDENTEYGYNFRGNADSLFLMTNVGGTWRNVYIDPWDGDPLLVEPDFTATLARAWPYDTGDPGNRVSGYERLVGHWSHLENGHLYVTYSGIGGNSQVSVYKDAARTSESLIGQTGMNTGSGYVDVYAQNSSGVGGRVTKTTVVETNASIVVDFRIQVGAGEGALFTPGESYFIWDYESGDRTGYFKVTAVDGDFLHIDRLDVLTPFSPGACISPYAHRWVIHGTNGTSGAGISNSPQVPMWASYTSPAGGGFYGAVSYDFMQTAIDKMSPNDSGKYAVQRPLLVEYQNPGGDVGVNSNRAWGRIRSLYVTSANGLSVMTFGRVINAQNYICFLILSSRAYLVLDSESLS